MPPAAQPLTGVMLHAENIDFTEDAGHLAWSPYEVLMFSLRSQFLDHGMTAAIAPPQKSLDWVLKNKPAPSNDNRWPEDTGTGLESASRLKAVFVPNQKQAQSLALMNSMVPGVLNAVQRQKPPQTAPKQLLLAFKPTGKHAGLLNTGEPILDVVMYRYADNALLWQCKMSAEPAKVQVSRYIRSDHRDVASGFTVARDLEKLMVAAGYLPAFQAHPPLDVGY